VLELLIRAWNPTNGKFVIQGKDIEFDATDIYFLIGLSRHGKRPILGGEQTSSESLDMLIAWVCPRAHKSNSSGKLAILIVEELVLHSVLFMVMRVVDSQAQHKATKTHLRLALDFLNQTMYNWAKTVTIDMKRQLTKCHHGEEKYFGYESILILLMLE